MCSDPALIKCIEHSHWGQVHQAKSISFNHNQFCTVQELKAHRQDVPACSDEGGESLEGQGESWDWIRVIEVKAFSSCLTVI